MKSTYLYPSYLLATVGRLPEALSNGVDPGLPRALVYLTESRERRDCDPRWLAIFRVPDLIDP